MAKTKVILVAGEALKKEKNFGGTTGVPGQLVANSAGEVVLAAASYADNIMVLDLSSANGFDIDGTYGEDSQVPVLYPTNGCVLNVVMDSGAATITKGDKLYWTGTGVKKVAASEPALFVAAETKTYAATDKRILVEVVK